MKYEQLQDAAWLKTRYSIDGLSLTALAAEVGCHYETLREALQRHGIPRRPRGSGVPTGPPPVVEIGGRYGWLTVCTLHDQPGRSGERMYYVQCDCGRFLFATGPALKAGKRTSCGCKPKARTHGRAHTPPYNAWNAMKQRCLNPNRPDFDRYGGRGIKVCDRWLNSFDTFIADIGERPGPDYSLDRIDVDGNYEPENCRWATRKEQRNNRRPHYANPTVAEWKALCAQWPLVQEWLNQLRA